MQVTISDGDKQIYSGAVPGLLLVTGSLVNRDKKTQTYKLVARSWGPPQLMSALALGGLKYLGRMRILATRDKSWLKVYGETREDAIKEARKQLVRGVVQLVNKYAPLTMQIEPVVALEKPQVSETTVKQKRFEKVTIRRKKKIKKIKHKKKKPGKIIGPGGDE